MYHLRVPVFLLTALVLLRCIAAAPSNRYFSHSSSSDDDEQENALVDKESRSLSELISDPFVGLGGPRPERQLTATNSQVPKNECNLGTCSQMNMASMLQCMGGIEGVREKLSRLEKQNKKTNVGPDSFGKRDIHQSPAQLPF